jgi:hypothetical protein
MTMGILVVAALAACIGPPHHDDIDIHPGKFGCHGRQALEVARCEPVLEY